ncbi:MAG: Holliday junction branch migration protein RuvA, partial [Planctomycetota bacterium]
EILEGGGLGDAAYGVVTGTVLLAAGRTGGAGVAIVWAMISRIRGNLVGVQGQTAEIDLGEGLTYEVMVPAYLAERLGGQVGRPLSLVTLQYLESQGQGSSYIPRLVGFLTETERRFFDLFTTVKGIGNRKALRAMAVEPSVIAGAIMARDTKALQQLPEIGKRMAETVIAELHGKVDGYLGAGEAAKLDRAAEIKPMGPMGAAGEEAVEALIALGDTRMDAERKVAKAAGKAGAGAGADAILRVVFGG